MYGEAHANRQHAGNHKGEHRYGNWRRSTLGIGMKDGRLGKLTGRKSDKARPSEPVLLTASPKRARRRRELVFLRGLQLGHFF